jgi:phage baseplate assembly protein W
MIATKPYTYIGFGWQDQPLSKYTTVTEYDNTINKKDASFTKKDRDLINESIYRILNTRIGERCGELDFGSRLAELVFEPNDNTLNDLARRFIMEALQKWEPRIRVIDTIIEQDPDNYTLKATVYYVTIIEKIEVSSTSVMFLQ